MTQLAALLPLAAVAALTWWAACRCHAAGCAAPWRFGFLGALLIGGAYLVCASEILSVFAALSYGAVAAAWLPAAIAGTALATRNRAPAPPLRLMPPSWPACGLAAIIAVVLSITALTAWRSPPNTWDALAYHMARVAHWADNQSLAFFATHVPRQNVYLPGAELALLHLQLLSGGDRLAAFVQWLSFAGTLVASSVVAAMLRTGATGQILAATLAATLPMAILQASSTKNDLVVSLWLLCLLVGTLAWQQNGRRVWSAWIGVSLGLALLTKITAWLYAPPMLGLMLWSALRGDRSERRRSLAVVLALGLLFIGPIFCRYAQLLYRAHVASVPLSAVEKPDDGIAVRSVRRGMLDNERYLNARMSPALLLANVARNLGLHATLPADGANRSIEHVVRWLLAQLAVADPERDTTYPQSRRFAAPGWSNHEDDAPNPLHLLVFAAALAMALVRWRERSALELRTWFCVVAGGLLFCLVLRWQPWHSRLHLPLFLIAAAPAAAVWIGLHRLWFPLAIVLGAAALPPLIAGAPRSLSGPDTILRRSRAELYFANRPDLYADYSGVVAELDRRDCDDVGIVMHGNDWEYPLWALGNPARRRSFRHLCVDNPSSIAAARRDLQSPCAVVLIEHPATERIDCSGAALPRVWSSPTIQLFAPS